MTTRTKRLVRTWYRTDVDTNDPEYVGTRSAPIPASVTDEIVAVDWSVPGEVQVTYLVPESTS